MSEFCHEVKPDHVRAALLNVVQGNHAFRRFKDQIAVHGLWEDWNRFRREAFAEIIRDWSEQNDVILTVRQAQTAR